MSSRQKRIRMLTEHRRKQLDEAVRELGARKREAEQQRLELEKATQHAELALDERNTASQRGVAIHEWAQLNDWLAKTRHAKGLAAEALVDAETAVETAQSGVMRARAAVKQVEALAEREQLRNRERERRLEQRANDEHAANARHREDLSR